MTDLDRLNKVLNERGYIVISSLEKLEIGQILPSNTVNMGRGCPEQVPGPLAVIAETNKADWDEDNRCAGWTPDHFPVPHYYRCTTD